MKNLVTFNINGERVMIERDILVLKSAYFEALLDGPLSVESDNVIDIKETDLDTFKKLMYFLRTNKYPALLQDLERVRLDCMASFYLVDIPEPAGCIPYWCRFKHTMKIKEDKVFNSDDFKKINESIFCLEYFQVEQEFLLFNILRNKDYSALCAELRGEHSPGVYFLYMEFTCPFECICKKYPGFETKFRLINQNLVC